MKTDSHSGGLEDLRRAKIRFLSLAAHELRTPLVSIKGYTDLILNNYSDEVSEKVKGLLRVVGDNAEKMIGLTDDLLTLRQLERGELDLHMEPVQTRKMLEDVLMKVRPLVEGRGQGLEVDIPGKLPSIDADEPHLKDCLIGLLISVSGLDPGEETIIVEAMETDEDIILQVSGKGINLSDDEMATLFDPFPDIEDLYSRGGSGVLLSICRGIVQLHNGEINVDRRKTGITSFTIILPIHNNQEESGPNICL